VLLKTEMVAGHGGISGRYERWKEAAFQYAWLLATADPENHGDGQVRSLFGGPRV
jgi:oligopeptidase B